MIFSKTIQKHKMLSPKDHVLVAVSGGADSVALLYGLLELREAFFLTISVAHINHNLRGDEAKKDADFVKGLCEDLEIPFFSYSADVRSEAKSRGLSLEESARQVRYSFLCEAARACGAQKIALGHNQNDNAETLLLRLCRGTGLRGLGGIPPLGEREGFTVIRPLIETNRDFIETFLKAKGISYRTDASNFDRVFSRNRIRHDIIPILEKISPKAVAQLAKSAELLREDEKLLDELTSGLLEECLYQEECFPQKNCLSQKSVSQKECLYQKNSFSQKERRVRLNISALLKTPEAMQKRIIRDALLRVGGLRDISQTHITQIINLTAGPTGKETHLPGGLRVRREYDFLLFFSRYETDITAPKGFCLDITPDTPIFIPALNRHILASGKIPCITSSVNSQEICTKYFNYDRIKGTLQLRTRRFGDRIVISGVGSKKLQDEFCDRKIPRDLRDTIPLLAIDGDILWIIGQDRVSGAYTPEPGSKVLAVSIY